MGLGWGLVFGLGAGLVWWLFLPPIYDLGVGLVIGLVIGLVLGLVFALVYGLGFGLLETRSVLITSRTPKEARSRSLIAALTWLVSGLVGGLVFGLVFGLGGAGLLFVPTGRSGWASWG